MLALFAVILIYSTPLDEIAKKAVLSINTTDEQRKDQPFSLKGGETIEITSFQFSGNKAIPTSQLQRLTKPYINRSLSQATLNEIKQRIEILYQSKGYTQAMISIPSKPKNGSLAIVIKEGKKD